MRHLIVVQFTPEEVADLKKAARLTDIAFPPNTDPLVPRERAVDPHHPMRRALLGLSSAYDLVAFDRLSVAHQALIILLDRVVEESAEQHWLSLVPRQQLTPMTRQHAAALAAERTGQQRLVLDALRIIEHALAPMSEGDDPGLLREEHFADA